MALIGYKTCLETIRFRRSRAFSVLCCVYQLWEQNLWHNNNAGCVVCCHSAAMAFYLVLLKSQTVAIILQVAKSHNVQASFYQIRTSHLAVNLYSWKIYCPCVIRLIKFVGLPPVNPNIAHRKTKKRLKQQVPSAKFGFAQNKWMCKVLKMPPASDEKVKLCSTYITACGFWSIHAFGPNLVTGLGPWRDWVLLKETQKSRFTAANSQTTTTTTK